MFCRPRSLSVLCLLSSLAFLPLAAAQGLPAGSLADQYADLNDVSGSPALLDPALKAVLDAAKPNTYFVSFDFPMPQPWASLVPPQVDKLIIECHAGWKVSSASPLCVTKYSYCHVEFVFSDGTRYTYTERSERTVCNTGSVSESHSQTQMSDLGLPGNRTFVFRRQILRPAPVQPPFMQLVRARGGVNADFRNLGGVPYISGDPLEIDIAPTGTLDLRQNPAAAGPVFVTDGPALIRCDTILLDPGVVIADLFSPPPILLPASQVAEESGVLPNFIARRSLTPFTMQVAVRNTGNVDQQFQVSWGGAHTAPGQTAVMIPVGDVVHVPVNFQIAPGTLVGLVDQAQIQIQSQTTPGVVRTETLHIAYDHPGQFRYGAGTPGNNGAHTVDADGPLQAGGPVVQVSTTGADPGALGLAMFGVPVGFVYGTIIYFGTDFYIDPQGPLFVTSLLVADPAGTSTFPLQIANAPALRGWKIDYQSVHLVTQVQFPFRLSSSPALSMTVQ